MPITQARLIRLLEAGEQYLLFHQFTLTLAQQATSAVASGELPPADALESLATQLHGFPLLDAPVVLAVERERNNTSLNKNTYKRVTRWEKAEGAARAALTQGKRPEEAKLPLKRNWGTIEDTYRVSDALPHQISLVGAGRGRITSMANPLGESQYKVKPCASAAPTEHSFAEAASRTGSVRADELVKKLSTEDLDKPDNTEGLDKEAEAEIKRIKVLEKFAAQYRAGEYVDKYQVKALRDQGFIGKEELPGAAPNQGTGAPLATVHCGPGSVQFEATKKGEDVGFDRESLFVEGNEEDGIVPMVENRP
jgi:hypothetical protein